MTYVSLKHSLSGCVLKHLLQPGEDNSGVSISDPDKRHLRLNYDTILKGHHMIDEVKGIFILRYMRKTFSVSNINLQNSIP